MVANTAALKRPIVGTWQERRARVSTAWVWFGIALAAYIAAGVYICFIGTLAAPGTDSMSRVAIANRILYSNDPHLAAIGFVWSPIPVMALLPLVALKPIWPALVTTGFAASIVSAIFMAGSVAQVHGLLSDLSMRRWLRWLLTASFAIQPMTVLYAANGMSEAAFIFFLALITRSLYRWLQSQETGALVATGFYLGLAYLTRYEAAAAAIAVSAVVAIVSLRLARGALRQRVLRALVDTMVVAAPFAVAFIAWAITSLIITGSAFDQFSSAYGTSSQISALGEGTVGSLGQLLRTATQAIQWILGIEPFLPLAALAALGVAARHRDWSRLSALAGLWGVLAFMLYVHLAHKVVPELRYYIVAVPLTVLLVGTALAPGSRPGTTPSRGGPRPTRHRTSRPMTRALRRARSIALPSLAVLAMAATVPAAAMAMVSPADDVGEGVSVAALSGSGQPASLVFAESRTISAYMDSLHLPSASVLIDDFNGYVIVMSSNNSSQYVIPSDRDFQSVLSDPYAAGIEYALIPPDRGLSALDAINRAYPHAYATGQGIGGKLVKQFSDPTGGGVDWRLYRVTGSS